MLLAADRSGPPAPRLGALRHDPVVALAGLAARASPCPPIGPPTERSPLTVVVPALVAPAPLRLGLAPAPASAPAQRAATAPRWAWAWALGSWLLAAALLNTLGLTLAPPAAEPEAAPPPTEMAAATPAPDVDTAPAVDLAALANLLNAELQRAGKAQVQVEVSPEAEAVVRGRVVDEAEHQEVLAWLGSVPVLRRVHDQLRVDAPPPPDARVPAPAPAAPSPPVVFVAPRPTPDAETLAREVRRELARLDLADLDVQVDPGSLQVTVRGRVNDAALKSQALAAARAAHPGGRVRDLVFVIEE